jgi:hypothetical protein
VSAIYELFVFCYHIWPEVRDTYDGMGSTLSLGKFKECDDLSFC